MKKIQIYVALSLRQVVKPSRRQMSNFEANYRIKHNFYGCSKQRAYLCEKLSKTHETSNNFIISAFFRCLIDNTYVKLGLICKTVDLTANSFLTVYSANSYEDRPVSFLFYPRIGQFVSHTRNFGVYRLRTTRINTKIANRFFWLIQKLFIPEDNRNKCSLEPQYSNIIHRTSNLAQVKNIGHYSNKLFFNFYKT